MMWSNTIKKKDFRVDGLSTTLLLLFPLLASAQVRPPNYSQDAIPETSFSCEDKITGGYYADVEAECQLFHVCVQVSELEFQDFRFLCPNDTVFDQQNLVCTNWFEVDCQQSVQIFIKDFGHKKEPTRITQQHQPQQPAKPGDDTEYEYYYAYDDDDPKGDSKQQQQQQQQGGNRFLANSLPAFDSNGNPNVGRGQQEKQIGDGFRQDDHANSDQQGFTEDEDARKQRKKQQRPPPSTTAIPVGVTSSTAPRSQPRVKSNIVAAKHNAGNRNKKKPTGNGVSFDNQGKQLSQPFQQPEVKPDGRPARVKSDVRGKQGANKQGFKEAHRSKVGSKVLAKDEGVSIKFVDPKSPNDLAGNNDVGGPEVRPDGRPPRVKSNLPPATRGFKQTVPTSSPFHLIPTGEPHPTLEDSSTFPPITSVDSTLSPITSFASDGSPTGSFASTPTTAFFQEPSSTFETPLLSSVDPAAQLDSTTVKPFSSFPSRNVVPRVKSDLLARERDRNSGAGSRNKVPVNKPFGRGSSTSAAPPQEQAINLPPEEDGDDEALSGLDRLPLFIDEIDEIEESPVSTASPAVVKRPRVKSDLSQGDKQQPKKQQHKQKQRVFASSSSTPSPADSNTPDGEDCVSNPFNCPPAVAADGRGPRVKANIQARQRNFYNPQQAGKISGLDKMKIKKNREELSEVLSQLRAANADGGRRGKAVPKPGADKNAIGNEVEPAKETHEPTVTTQAVEEDVVVTTASSATSGDNDYFYADDFQVTAAPPLVLSTSAPPLVISTTVSIAFSTSGDLAAISSTHSPRGAQAKPRFPTKEELLDHVNGIKVFQNFPSRRPAQASFGTDENGLRTRFPPSSRPTPSGGIGGTVITGGPSSTTARSQRSSTEAPTSDAPESGSTTFAPVTNFGTASSAILGESPELPPQATTLLPPSAAGEAEDNQRAPRVKANLLLAEANKGGKGKKFGGGQQGFGRTTTDEPTSTTAAADLLGPSDDPIDNEVTPAAEPTTTTASASEPATEPSEAPPASEPSSPAEPSSTSPPVRPDGRLPRVKANIKAKLANEPPSKFRHRVKSALLTPSTAGNSSSSNSSRIGAGRSIDLESAGDLNEVVNSDDEEPVVRPDGQKPRVKSNILATNPSASEGQRKKGHFRHSTKVVAAEEQQQPSVGSLAKGLLGRRGGVGSSRHQESKQEPEAEVTEGQTESVTENENLVKVTADKEKVQQLLEEAIIDKPTKLDQKFRLKNHRKEQLERIRMQQQTRRKQALTAATTEAAAAETTTAAAAETTTTTAEAEPTTVVFQPTPAPIAPETSTTTVTSTTEEEEETTTTTLAPQTTTTTEAQTTTTLAPQSTTTTTSQPETTATSSTTDKALPAASEEPQLPAVLTTGQILNTRALVEATESSRVFNSRARGEQCLLGEGKEGLRLQVCSFDQTVASIILS